MPNSSTKVCFLINQLAPGGAPTLLLDIIRHTEESAEIEYTVCFIEGENTLASDLEDAGARVVDFEAAFKFDPRAMWRLARFFQREQFDILHTHLPYSQTLGRVFGRLGGIQNIVSTQHSMPENYHPVTRMLEWMSRPFDTKTIAISESVEREFTGTAHRYEPGHSGQWCTIYNGVDVTGFNERVTSADIIDLKSRHGIGDEPVFLNIGRYVPAKSQHDLIAAMDQVIRDYPNARLFIVGWGTLEDELTAAVNNHDLMSNITLTGRISPSNIHRYYALADVFVSSSTTEGLSISILEAMASKLPIVATDIPGLDGIIENEVTGILVPPNSADQLADAMKQAIMTEEPLGDQGYESAVNNFDIEETATHHIQLYHDLANQK